MTSLQQQNYLEFANAVLSNAVLYHIFSIIKYELRNQSGAISAIQRFGFTASTRELCFWGYEHMVYYAQIYLNANKLLN